MRSIQTSHTFSLSAVKPLEGLLNYRAYCLMVTRKALRSTVRRRDRSPVGRAPLEPVGGVDGFEYLRCPETGSLFLAELPSAAEWATLLAEVSQHRRSPKAFHSGIAELRSENVYAPKLGWIQSTLRLQEVRQPRLMEVVTPPSDFTRLLRGSRSFAEVLTVDEMELVMTTTSEGPFARGQSANSDNTDDVVHTAVLLESLDRVDDPTALLRAVRSRLADGGLLFVTALVYSGFDMAVLGLRNLYLYPPDRANCFTLRGLELLLTCAGFALLEVSTPGVLDVEIVQAHLRHDPSLPLSAFERQLLAADVETHAAFQSFLQEHGMSSFARIVGRKQP